MKIRIFNFLFFLSLNFLIFNVSIGNDQINFNVTELEIIDNGNIIKGSNKGVATTNDGLKISADSFIYNKKTNTLIAEGNVEVLDLNKKIKLYAQEINYKKNENIIKARGKVRTKDIKNDTEIFADNATYDQKNEILIAEGQVNVLNNTYNNEILAEKITYFKNIEEIKSEGKTKAKVKNEYLIESKNIIYKIKSNQLNSKFKTKISDNKNQVFFLNKFEYSINVKILKGEQLLFIRNYNLPNSDKIYLSNAIIDLKNKKFTGKDPEIYVQKDIFNNNENDPRIKGVSAEGDEKFTKVNKGFFTSCKKKDDCPPWSIKASKVEHDKIKKQIQYENAVLNIYNLPVFYFPKFFHPDPTVKRQSGFLKPELNSSKILGSSISLPYFKAISENKDFTFTPIWFDKDIIMSNTEYRQLNKKSDFQIDFGFVKNYESSSTKKTKNLSHFFGKYNLDLGIKNFNTSDLSLSLERVSNDNYLRIFNSHITKSSLRPSNFDTLNNSITVFLDHQNYSFESGIETFETLKSKKTDRYQYILPYYNFSRSIPQNQLSGDFTFYSTGNNDLNETNSLKTNIINDLNYNKLNILPTFGLKSDFNVNFKNINSVGKKTTVYKSSPDIELVSLFNVNLSLPLIKKTNNYKNYITPKISFSFNPGDMQDYSSSENSITVDNIFSTNRLGLSDTLEAGRSLTLGFDFKKEENNSKDLDKYFEFKLATVLRDKEEESISSKSTLNKKNSNLFGSINYHLSENIKFDYNFSLDNNYSTFEYNDFNASFSLNNIITGFSFIEENGELGDTNVLSSSISYKLDESNSLKFNTRRNRKINLTEYYDLVYEYKNDCLTAGIKYNKTYYSDGDLKPSENLFFTVTLIPLTSYEYSANEILDR